MHHSKEKEDGRLFYLRTEPSVKKMSGYVGRGFPAVCVATKARTIEDQASIKVMYALAVYNLKDLKLGLPFSRKEARNKARGRLSSPSHCRTLTIPTTDVPHHVKQRICEDIIQTSKSQIARACAYLWCQANRDINRDFIKPRPAEPPVRIVEDSGGRRDDLGDLQTPEERANTTDPVTSTPSTFLDQMFGRE